MAPSRDIEEASNGIIAVDDEPTHRPCFTRKKKILIACFNVMVVAVILGVFLSKSKTTVGSTNQLNEENSPYGAVASSSASAVVESNQESTSTESGTSDNGGNNDADLASTPKKEVTGVSFIATYEGPLPAIVSPRVSQAARDTCDSNEVLTTLDLVTDGYAWETSWEIKRSDGTQLAFGPPTGQKYDRMTSYLGELCLPVGRNILVIRDSAGDGEQFDYCVMNISAAFRLPSFWFTCSCQACAVLTATAK